MYSELVTKGHISDMTTTENEPDIKLFPFIAQIMVEKLTWWPGSDPASQCKLKFIL